MTFPKSVHERESGFMVTVNARVIKTLPDDNKGSRHQKFLLKLGSGRSLLFSHNIDLAPRINSLRRGDRVDFRGQYEFNDKGGAVHWTHHDPSGRRSGGWIKHKSKTYK